MFIPVILDSSPTLFETANKKRNKILTEDDLIEERKREIRRKIPYEDSINNDWLRLMVYSIVVLYHGYTIEDQSTSYYSEAHNKNISEPNLVLWLNFSYGLSRNHDWSYSDLNDFFKGMFARIYLETGFAICYDRFVISNLEEYDFRIGFGKLEILTPSDKYINNNSNLVELKKIQLFRQEDIELLSRVVSSIFCK